MRHPAANIVTCDVSRVTCHVSPHVHQQTALQLEHFCTVFAHVSRVAVRGGEVLAQLLVGVGAGGRALVFTVELGHLQIESTYFSFQDILKEKKCL